MARERQLTFFPHFWGANSLEEVPPASWRALREKVAAAKGKLVLLVHPYHLADSPPPTYLPRLKKLLSSSKTPILVLEESEFVRDAHAQFKTQGMDHLILPTERGNPFLVLKEDEVEGSKFDENLSELKKILVEAGAKTILVGGAQTLLPVHNLSAPLAEVEHRRLSRRRPDFPKFDRTGGFGCAGFTYNVLARSRDFDTVALLPSLVHPHYPDYMKIVKELQQERVKQLGGRRLGLAQRSPKTKRFKSLLAKLFPKWFS